MENRETKIFVTPIGKHQVEIKTYITGREKRALQGVWLSGDLSIGSDQSVRGLKGDIIAKAEDLAIQLLVVSIDGKKDGENGFSIVDAVLDMNAEDYTEVIRQINLVSNDSSFEKKKAN